MFAIASSSLRAIVSDMLSLEEKVHPGFTHGGLPLTPLYGSQWISCPSPGKKKTSEKTPSATPAI